ncbi:MAG: threonine/serine exporter family protein [Erysipelotrichaceae bacterium]|nr:threonine/serine exporter family protein [Erysipelotrichaceae bacterium]
MTIFIHCLAAFFGCLGFSFIFRVFKNMHFAFIGSGLGALGYFIYVCLDFTNNVYLQTFIGMLVVALLSEMFARILKAPATIFIVIGCFPLVPGSGIYNTMFYAVQGYDILFISSLLQTLGISMSIALGILISSTSLQVYKRIKNHEFEKSE